mgnify:CR=1 FL=1
MSNDGYLGYFESLEPVPQPPALNRCPCMRRVWELMMGGAKG